MLKDIDDGGPAQAALAKAAEMTAEAVAALEGLDEQASAEEVARRLGGEVSPAVLALMKALLVQASGLGTVTKTVEGSAGSRSSMSRSRRSPPTTATSGRCCCTGRSAGTGR
ncbi:hypothetical protein AB0E67_34585 [Streptomyces sp. NPDC032161]|uniref:hypothetical protein n=1 Tax=unclassified Streptomyces TaxID=2593676 RepID=UPI0033CEC879